MNNTKLVRMAELTFFDYEEENKKELYIDSFSFPETPADKLKQNIRDTLNSLDECDFIL
jgi:hypothetical protein